MTKDKWIWMPHPGHFICSRWCRFHLNTYVGGYIVSTVGEYWPEENVRRIHAEVWDKVWLAENSHRKGDDFDAAYLKHFGYEEIGAGRKYETMVFKAVKSKRQAGWDCCPWEQNSGMGVDFNGYDTATEAYKGHLKLCAKWSKKS